MTGFGDGEGDLSGSAQDETGVLEWQGQLDMMACIYVG
jgi:hypothetical protein